MNVAEFALRVTHAIGIDAATANSATSQEYTLFLSWLNEGVVDFLRKTKLYKQTAILSVTAGQSDYSVDSAVLAFEDLYYAPNGGTSRMLEQVDSSRLRELRIMADTTDSDPRYYAYEGNLIMMYPAPLSSSDRLHMVYVPRPTAMSTTAHDPSATGYGGIPSEYHPVLESYVKWKAAEHANDKASGNGAAFAQQYTNGVVDARVSEQRKAGMLIGRVNMGRANWRSYARPGVDVG